MLPMNMWKLFIVNTFSGIAGKKNTILNDLQK